MSFKTLLTCFIALASFAGAAAADQTTLAKEVREAEQAFAATMAARDHAAFTRHLAEEAVFFDGEKAIRGKAAIASAWKAYFDGPNPPFSWSPENVEVLDSGTLAYSSGPVLDPKGSALERSIQSGAAKRMAPGASCSIRAAVPATVRSSKAIDSTCDRRAFAGSNGFFGISPQKAAEFHSSAHRLRRPTASTPPLVVEGIPVAGDIAMTIMTILTNWRRPHGQRSLDGS